MPSFDLETTYLSLDGRGRVAEHPVDPSFWETIDANPDLLSTLVGVYAFDGDWPHWEMHPEGEEVLVLLEGAMTLILDEGGRERRVEMQAGSTFVVPRGAWHRGLVADSARLMTLTYGAGSQHRPISA